MATGSVESLRRELEEQERRHEEATALYEAEQARTLDELEKARAELAKAHAAEAMYEEEQRRTLAELDAARARCAQLEGCLLQQATSAHETVPDIAVATPALCVSSTAPCPSAVKVPAAADSLADQLRVLLERYEFLRSPNVGVVCTAVCVAAIAGFVFLKSR
eukprot:TRINITY_DN3087_c0_g2_i4.p3 TRINITY_DN3087_c0_g2~~TRINITY_DN3087_c0_g2_i4.p3  ORF type:complete len:172 (+),score=60.22 TRINITY_DN3087_c0_g2_i4:28-516(+)